MRDEPKYSEYSLDDLYDCFYNINRDRYPDRTKRILTEIESRKKDNEQKAQEDLIIKKKRKQQHKIKKESKVIKKSKIHFFEGAKTGWGIVKHSIKILIRYPIFILPILLCWLFYAPSAIYLKYYFPWESFTFGQILIIAFIIITGFHMLFSFSSIFLLELIEQLETGKKFNLINAVHETFVKDLPKAFPIILIWSSLSFVLLILEAIFSRNKDDSKTEAKLENFAKTLSGYEKRSLISVGFEALQKGLRMIAFIIFPAITWEDLPAKKALRKGINTLKYNISEFVSGYIITYAAATIIFIPPAIIFKISEKSDIVFPEYIWVITIIYIAFAWSFSLYIEQMFGALLYMWNKKWVNVLEECKINGIPLPERTSIKQPSLLDDIPDLK